MTLSKLPFAAASICALAACSSQPVTSSAGASSMPRDCFSARDVNGFSSVSDTVVDVKVGSNRFYRLTTDGSCPSGNFQPRIALRTLSGGSWICQGLDAEIVVPDAAGAERCQVRAIQPITKADWLADSHPGKR